MLISLMSFSLGLCLCLSFYMSPLGFSVFIGGHLLSGSGFAHWSAFQKSGELVL